MPHLQVFEPAMCCSTGLCGTDLDPVLVQFAADLKSVAALGTDVSRFNLATNPDAFVNHPLVYQTITTEGMDVLPLILVDGVIVSRGRHPSLVEIAHLLQFGPADGQEARAQVAAESCCGDNGSDCC